MHPPHASNVYVKIKIGRLTSIHVHNHTHTLALSLRFLSLSRLLSDATRLYSGESCVFKGAIAYTMGGLMGLAMGAFLAPFDSMNGLKVALCMCVFVFYV